MVYEREELELAMLHENAAYCCGVWYHMYVWYAEVQKGEVTPSHSSGNFFQFFDKYNI